MTMNILTYNLQNWQNPQGQSNVQQVLDVLRETDAHLIGLNEVLHPHPSPVPNLSALDYLARELGMDVVFGPAFQPTNAFHLPEVMSGNAVLSRYPILASAAHHLTPVVQNQRGLLEARVLLPDGRPFTLYVTHLEPRDEAVRVQQTRALLSWTVRDRGKPHVLMGDLNTYNPADVSDAAALQALREQTQARGFTFFQAQVLPLLLKSGYLDACAHHPQPTWDTPQPWVRMDFILVSEPLAQAVRSCQAWDTPASRQASDHLPVLAALTLPDAS